MRRLLYVLMICSYSLLFGVGTTVLIGGAHVLFFAPLEAVDPSSLNQNSPLWQKLGFLGFVLFAIAVGYAINRIVWGRFLRHFNTDYSPVLRKNSIRD